MNAHVYNIYKILLSLKLKKNLMYAFIKKYINENFLSLYIFERKNLNAKSKYRFFYVHMFFCERICSKTFIFEFK